VDESWRGDRVKGWMGFILKEKLKGLKFCIRVWNKEVYGVVDSKIEKLVEDINELDVKGELVSLSEAEVENRKDYFGELWHLLKSKESVLLQRSRTRWLREGDQNSAYFHACEKSRGNRNFLNALKVDGR
jgi:hypothetical protein